MQIQVYPDKLPWRYLSREEHKDDTTAYGMFWITPTHQKYGGSFIIDLRCKVVTPLMADVKWGYHLPKSYVRNCLDKIFVGGWRTVHKRFDNDERYFICFTD